jgi:N-formylglutamate deformylase
MADPSPHIPRRTGTTPVADAVRVELPRAVPVPLVVDSPHSGMVWPADFRPAAPDAAILTTWDAWVEELWAGAPDAGATLVHARFPRAYIDVNRGDDDLDLALVDGAWPHPTHPTGYSERGMGLIRRDALPGVPMYDHALSVDAVEHRLSAYYRPYRAALRDRLDALHAEHGAVWLLDCHSMKSRGNRMNVDAGAARPDIVISDRRGTSAGEAHTTWVAEWFRAHGFDTRVNDPYQGGDLARTFGRPAQQRHAIQVEVNRARYMDEAAVARHQGFAALQEELAAFLSDFAAHLRAVLGSLDGAAR